MTLILVLSSRAPVSPNLGLFQYFQLPPHYGAEVAVPLVIFSSLEVERTDVRGTLHSPGVIFCHLSSPFLVRGQEVATLILKQSTHTHPFSLSPTSKPELRIRQMSGLDFNGKL